MTEASGMSHAHLHADTEHLHDRSHLATGGVLRCGCGPESLSAVDVLPEKLVCDFQNWMPHRHQVHGFVRTRFSYDTRTPRTFQRSECPDSSA